MRHEKSDSLERYFKSIQNLNPLKKEEELDLARKAQAGDQRALDTLVTHNLKIVVTIANRNIGRGILVDDLIQQGNMGLIDAALKFDPNREVRFASFAGTRVLKYMNQLIDTCGRAVRIPVNQEYDRYQKIKAGEDVKNLNTVKIDDFCGSDEKETKGNRIFGVAPSIDEEYEYDHFKIKVTHLLDTLKERDREILKLYYGIDTDEEVPTKDIAVEFGLTQIRVCQIINTAKKQLKKHV